MEKIIRVTGMRFRRVLICLFVQVLCISSVTFAGPLYKHPTNGRYFTDGSGKAIYLTGSHTWGTLIDYPSSSWPPLDWNAYLNFLQGYDHNFIRLWTGDCQSGGSPLKYVKDGSGKVDLTQLNQVYFDRLRARVIAARDRGIYVDIMLFRGDDGAKAEDWPTNFFNSAVNTNGINGDPNSDGMGLEAYNLSIPAITSIQEAYARKVIDTVNDLDNVLYEIGNEADLTSVQWQYHMINYVKNYESTSKPKQHPVGMTAVFNIANGSWATDNSALFSSPADWISPGLDPYKNNPPAADGSKVIIADTDHIWPTTVPRYGWIWQCFLRGIQPILMDWYTYGTPPSDKYTSAEQEAMRVYMGYTLTYANKMDLANMTPQGSLASTGYCLASSGSEYLVYQPGSGQFTLNLSGASGTFTLEWFNPSNGDSSQGSNITGGATRTLTPPFSGAVAYLKAQTQDTTPPGNVASVRDGTGIDISEANSSTQLSANWDEATDNESGISGYKYAIGTTAGGTDVTPWTTIGNILTVTKTGLTLTAGTAYYFSVKAVNGALTPLESLNAANSNGQVAPQQEAGLVGHWKLDEASGTNAGDSSGNGYTGTLHGAPVWDPTGGRIGGALSLNGTGTYVEINRGAGDYVEINQGMVGNNPSFSICLWFKTTLTFNGKMYYEAYGDKRFFCSVNEEVAGDAESFWWNNDSDYSKTFTGNISLNNGQWHHMAFIQRSKSDRELFIDGVSKGVSTAMIGNFTPTESRLGARNMDVGDGFRYFKGSLDDVRIYNRALSQAEVQNLYNPSVDTTPPSAPGAVNDGTGADVGSTSLTTRLSANWTAATDGESGISGYKYAIGTTAGGTSITNWTTLGNVLTVTKTGLSLTIGTTYYFAVKAVNGASPVLESGVKNSNGQFVVMGGTNLALNKSVTVSSERDPATQAKENAVDGNTATFWASTFSDPQWIYVDLGNTYNVNRVVLNWEAAYGRAYQIQVSANAADWTQAYTTTSGDGGTDDISFTPVSGRYVRMYGTARGTQWGYSLYEFEVYGSVATTDTTPPSAVGVVRDGTGTGDISSTTSRTQLSANWTDATDAQSGISGYSYAIGTTAGGTQVLNWTALWNVLTVTKTGLSLSVGTTYYFSVKAVNGAGLTGSAVNSNGQVVISTATADTTPPSAPGTVRDGAVAGTDAGFTYSTATLSVNWTAAADAESGIANYQYAIGTAAGATNITSWTTIGNVLTVTKTRLSLTVGTTYYFSVKAVNGYGLAGSAANSNGQYVAAVNTADTTPPADILQVNDGAETGTDAGVTYLTDELSANWTPSADADSGISRYLYAIGTTPGATDITNWKDNGELTEVTETGLTLAVGATYYFSVKAENGVSLQSDLTSSDGQLVLSMDNQGPLISNVSAQGITNAGATIIWVTDEPSTSRVEYGLTVIYGSLTGEYTGMNTAHSVTLTGLLSETQYHYRVIGRDYAGNESVSVDFTFTTLSTLNEVTEIRAYPNPCDFKNGQVVKFKVGSAGPKFEDIKIYTISGKLVKKLSGTSGTIDWDGTNEDNERVSRGVYIYRITEINGDTVTEKLAVKK